MKAEELPKIIRLKIEALEKIRNEDLPVIIGEEAVKHFRQSFRDEGFTDETLEKWPDVKRRDPSSKWYGFSYGANSVKPGQKKLKKGEVRTGKTNFSPTRTKDKILTGETNELMNSISYVVKPDRVTIRSDKPYSQVQNEGGLAKVFGKASFQMKARPFIGHSSELKKKIYAKIQKEIDKIKNQ